jgi:hypothetical protein
MVSTHSKSTTSIRIRSVTSQILSRRRTAHHIHVPFSLLSCRPMPPLLISYRLKALVSPHLHLLGLDLMPGDIEVFRNMVFDIVLNQCETSLISCGGFSKNSSYICSASLWALATARSIPQTIFDLLYAWGFIQSATLP